MLNDFRLIPSYFSLFFKRLRYLSKSCIVSSMKNKVRRRKINEILSEAFNGKHPFENELPMEEDNTDTNDTDEVSFLSVNRDFKCFLK